MIDFFEVVNIRQSIRSFTATPVEEDKLQQILETINRAPSAGNLQAYEVYVVKDAGVRADLASAAFGQEFIVQAPVALVFCTHAARAEWRYKSRGVKLYTVQDATIACTYAMLTCTALGLATVWVGAFNEEEVHKIIEAPAEHRPVSILPIGYAAEQPEPRPRRKLEDLIHWL